MRNLGNLYGTLPMFQHYDPSYTEFNFTCVNAIMRPYLTGQDLTL